MKLTDLDQRPEPLNGATLLNQLHAALTRYVILPSPEAADAVTLYIAATHAQPAWEHASRLVIKSPVKRCGKTRLQEVCRETVHNPLPTTNISPAALARSIDEDDPPTLILDEADTVWGKKDQRSEGAEDIRGILNSGHSRGWPYVRWDAAARRRELCPTFAMAIIGGIGDMPDTIEDRAVVISMRRRAPGEQVSAWRSRRAIPELRAIRDQLHEWVRSHLSELGDAEPDVPAEDRAADVWEPLVAIADLAGGDWPERARHACKVLSGVSNDPEEGTAGERLLADLRDVFGTATNLSTATILEALCRIEEAPWGTWHRGEKLSPRGLAALLKPYGIRSKNVKIAGQVVKGYARADMVDAWERYLPLPATDGVSAQVEAVADAVADDSETTATEAVADAVADVFETSATGPDQQKLTEVAEVAPVAADRLNGAMRGEPMRAIKPGQTCCETGDQLTSRCQLCSKSPTFWRRTEGGSEPAGQAGDGGTDGTDTHPDGVTSCAAPGCDRPARRACRTCVVHMEQEMAATANGHGGPVSVSPVSPRTDS